MSNIFAIGDIHGHLNKLQEILKNLEINWKNDQIIFLGDYIDRGPDSKGVVNFLIDLKNKHENIIFCCGNHEDMLLDFINCDPLDLSYNEKRYLFLRNGGYETLKSYKTKKDFDIPEEHMEFFENTVLYHETDDFMFSHAGHNPYIKKQQRKDFLWTRELFINSKGSEFTDKVCVFGHTSYKKPYIDDFKIGIDTGCAYGHDLTMVKLPEIKFFQV